MDSEQQHPSAHNKNARAKQRSSRQNSSDSKKIQKASLGIGHMTLIMGQHNSNDMRLGPVNNDKSNQAFDSEQTQTPLQPKSLEDSQKSSSKEDLAQQLVPGEQQSSQEDSKRRIVINDIGYSHKRVTQLESVEAESSGGDNDTDIAMRAPGRLQGLTEQLLVEEDTIAPQIAHAGDFDSQNDRQAFADIAQSTVSSPLGAMLLTKQQLHGKQNQSKLDQFKLTVGSVGVTQGDSTTELGHSTLPDMSRARLTNMMNITSNNAMTMAKVTDQKRTASNMTKAEVSLANTEDDSFYKDAKGRVVDSRNQTHFDKQANTINSAFSHTLYQIHESGKTLHNEGVQTPAQLLPFLKSGPTRNENQSSALLQFQPSTNSLRQGAMQANAANMQSQSPLRSIGLDFDAESRLGHQKSMTKDGRDQQLDMEASIGAGLYGNPGSMPPLKTLNVSDSMVSSQKYINMIPRSGQETPNSHYMVIDPARSPAAQNWAQRRELTIQEFLQLQKTGQTPIDDVGFLNKFEMKDVVLENSMPSTMRNSPMHSGSKKNVMGRTGRDLVGNSKTPFLRDMTDQLFDFSKTPSKNNGGVFSARSRSMMVNPATITAYTPKPKQSLMVSPMITNKRHSSILSQKKSKAVRQLGFIKNMPDQQTESLIRVKKSSDDQEAAPTFSPTINFPDSNLLIKNSQLVGLKSSAGGHIGANRFEDGEDTLNIPSQVIEQWLDAVLEEDQIEVLSLPAAQRENGKQKMTKAVAQASKVKLRDEKEYIGIGKVQKVSDSMGASLRYGLDYQSLSRNGLNKEQITRLHRALYANTNGFYNTVREATRAATNKKKVIVGVMQVYQQLLEKCHQNEWKMLINEVANAYEDEDIARKGELQGILDQKDAVIGNLKREILSLNERQFQMEKEVVKEKDAFERLHEAYMILQNHNEQNLALRLTTEERLKTLFKRDRKHLDQIKKTQAEIRDDKDTLMSNEARIQMLSEDVLKLRNTLIEKEGMSCLVKDAMNASKRRYQVCMKQLEEIKKPYERLKQQEPKLRAIIETNEADSRLTTMKTGILSGQVEPFIKQIKLLENEIKSLKNVNNLQEVDIAKMSTKQRETLQELTDRAETFYWAEEQLKKKDKELVTMENKMNATTKRMDAFELEKKKANAQMLGLEEKVKQNVKHNETLTEVIANLEKYEYAREQQLVAEKETNERMLLEVHAYEREARNAETSTIWMLQSQIDDQVKHIARLGKEVELKQVAQDNDRKYHKEDKKRMQESVIKYSDMQHKYRFEAKAVTRSEQAYRHKYNDLHSKITDYTTKITLLEQQVAVIDQMKEDHSKIVADNEAKIYELEIALEQGESQQIRKEAVFKAYEAQRKEGQDIIQNELLTKEDKLIQVMNSNIMIGEDFRSKAFMNAMEIVELKEVICYLKAEPEIYKQQSKAILTQLKKVISCNRMMAEDERQEKLRLLRVIDGKDQTIAQLEFRHTEDLFLVDVMRTKIGKSGFSVKHQFVQVGQLCKTTSAQTVPPANHKAIQARGFNMTDAPAQTDIEKVIIPVIPQMNQPIEISRQLSKADSNMTSTLNDMMPAKKVKKKGNVRKQSVRNVINDDESNGSQSPRKNKTLKQSPGASKFRQNSMQQDVGSLFSPEKSPKESKLKRVKSVLPAKSTQLKDQKEQANSPPPSRPMTIVDLDEELLGKSEDASVAMDEKEGFSDSVSSDTGQLNMAENLNSGKYISIVEEESTPVRTKKKSKGASLSRPGKFKLENRQLTLKKSDDVNPNATPVPSLPGSQQLSSQQELTGPAVPEELARKTVRSGAKWHQNNKQQEDQQKKRSKQMRGLIKSAVNRDLD